MVGKKQLQSWLALHLIPGLGPVSCHKLAAHFSGPDKILATSVVDLGHVCRLRQETLAALSGAGRNNLLMRAENEIKAAADRNIKILSYDDPHYPHLLKNIHDRLLFFMCWEIPKCLTARESVWWARVQPPTMAGR